MVNKIKEGMVKEGLMTDEEILKRTCIRLSGVIDAR
jgi:hypothetical protein